MTNLRRSLLWVTILALPASLLLLLPLNAQEKSAPPASAPKILTLIVTALLGYRNVVCRGLV